MITRDNAKEMVIITKSEVYPYSIQDNVNEVIERIFDSIEQCIAELEKPELCNTCTFDHCGCSIQASILQVEPDATFDTFGCVHYEKR